MIVSVGEITAKCRKCGRAEFTPVIAGALRLATVLVCAACRTSTTYRELMDQVGEDAIRRANAAVDALRKKTGRPRKPRK